MKYVGKADLPDNPYRIACKKCGSLKNYEFKQHYATTEFHCWECGKFFYDEVYPA